MNIGKFSANHYFRTFILILTEYRFPLWKNWIKLFQCQIYILSICFLDPYCILGHNYNIVLLCILPYIYHFPNKNQDNFSNKSHLNPFYLISNTIVIYLNLIIIIIQFINFTFFWGVMGIYPPLHSMFFSQVKQEEFLSGEVNGL